MWKFHFGTAEFPKLFFAQVYTEFVFGPLTLILSVIGNVILKLVSQKSFISEFVPGSCPPNWLDGKPITTKPLSLYVS